MSGMKVKGEVRARFAKRMAGDFEVRQTGYESLAMCQIEPPNLEMTRADKRFLLGNSAAITGIAPVQALPTTAAQWAIWNPDPTKTFWMEELGMYLTSGTPGVGGVLLACLFQTPAQTGSNVAGATVSGAKRPSGTGAASSAIIKTGVTVATPAAPVWYPIATNPSPNVTAFAGSTFLEHRNLAGAIAVPPGFGLGLAVVAPAGTTPLFAPFARWVELESDNE